MTTTSYPQSACSDCRQSKAIFVGLVDNAYKGLTTLYTHLKSVLWFLGSYPLPPLSSILSEISKDVWLVWLLPCRHFLRPVFLIFSSSVTTHLLIFPFSKSSLLVKISNSLSSCQSSILFTFVTLYFLYHFITHQLSFCWSFRDERT